MNLETLKQNFSKITTVLFCLLFIFRGCTNSKINQLKEKNMSLEQKVDSLLSSTPSRAQVRDEMEWVMFNYLIYEDDLDKGKTSLSEIKDKIQSNDKVD